MPIKKRIICSECATEKTGSYCPFCKKDTPSNESTEIYGKHRLRGLFTLKFVGKGSKAKQIVRSGWKKSGDPKIKDGVYEDRIIDREKKEYHQVVKDADSGNIRHEEHEPLDQHKPKKD